MKRRAFKGGVHPREYKLTATSPIESMPLPERVLLPLSQHLGGPAKATVKAGDQAGIVTLGKRLFSIFGGEGA